MCASEASGEGFSIDWGRCIVVARANISLDRDVFDSFSAQVDRNGKTIYASTNEWLGAASEILAEGGDAKDLLRLWRSYSVLKQVDVITLPSDFVDDAIGKLYEADKVGILEMFDRLGSNLVGLLKIVAPDIEHLAVLAKDFVMLMPVKRLEMKKVDGDSVQVSVVGAGKKISSTECSLAFIKAILNGYGRNVASQEASVGTISLRALGADAWGSPRYADA